VEDDELSELLLVDDGAGDDEVELDTTEEDWDDAGIEEPVDPLPVVETEMEEDNPVDAEVAVMTWNFRLKM